MAVSPSNHNHHQKGLTLIEVLIALAIIGIALTAIIKATSENIRATTYLQDKTISMWVGEYVLNQARVGLLHFPEAPEQMKSSTNMLGRDWFWQASQEQTPNRRIKKIKVKLFKSDQEEAASLLTLETYVYRAD